MNNCLQATKKILELLKVPCTKGYLKDVVLSHSHYPSLLTISDALDKYNLSQIPVKIGKEKLDQVPLPCIVQVSGPGMDLFYTLVELSESEAVFFDENGRKTSTGRKDFLDKWTGVALLVERNEGSAEPEIGERLKRKKLEAVLLIVLACSMATWLVIGLFFGETNSLNGVLPLITTSGYLLLKVTGLVVSLMLLWREIDRNNPAIQKFCSGGANTDCNAVLDAAVVKFADGAINLASLAFSYFFGGFLLLLFFSFSPSALAFLGWLSILSLPIVIWSFYYQAIQIKKWCRFCLLIQGILLLEVFTACTGRFYAGEIVLENALAYATFFLTVILGWMYLKPHLASQNDLYQYKRNLGRFKSNPDVFEKLLSQSRKISMEAEGLGILLKSESPKYRILKVSNPYCGPCAKAHTALEEIYKRGNTELQIVFSTNADPEDLLTKTVSHFLAIHGKGDSGFTRKALDMWYGAGEKDYDVFARKFKLNGELFQQGESHLAMKAWCESEGITRTPTIFINGYELPKDYTVEDLKGILI